MIQRHYLCAIISGRSFLVLLPTCEINTSKNNNNHVALVIILKQSGKVPSWHPTRLSDKGYAKKYHNLIHVLLTGREMLNAIFSLT